MVWVLHSNIEFCFLFHSKHRNIESCLLLIVAGMIEKSRNPFWEKEEIKKN